MPPCIIIKVNRGRKVAVVAEALCSQLSLRLLLLLGTTTTATTMSKLLFKINLANNMQNVHSLTKSKISVPKTKSLMNSSAYDVSADDEELWNRSIVFCSDRSADSPIISPSPFFDLKTGRNFEEYYSLLYF